MWTCKLLRSSSLFDMLIITKRFFRQVENVCKTSSTFHLEEKLSSLRLLFSNFLSETTFKTKITLVQVVKTTNAQNKFFSKLYLNPFFSYSTQNQSTAQLEKT